MSDINNIVLKCRVGEAYELHVPVNDVNMGGYYPETGSVNIPSGETVELRNGFWVENTDIGDIISVSSDKLAATYKQKIYGDNTVWFYALTGERVRLQIVMMSPHDHSSISEGGPAYGTYYSEIIQEDE